SGRGLKSKSFSGNAAMSRTSPGRTCVSHQGKCARIVPASSAPDRRRSAIGSGGVMRFIAGAFGLRFMATSRRLGLVGLEQNTGRFRAGERNENDSPGPSGIETPDPPAEFDDQF